MKNEKLFQSIGEIEDTYIKEAMPQRKISDSPLPPRKIILRILPAAACITVFLIASTALAAGYVQNSISTFYLRYLSPQEMAVADSMAEQYGAKVYFDGLKTDDWYSQYFAINKLVEFYNDETTRMEAINAITPFLTSEEAKIADAASFALSILTRSFDDPRIIHLADGSVVFTLFNDYSDYGSYNQLWRIADGELTEYMSLNPPHMYIRQIIPSPDHKLLAVVACSNKSEYIWIYDIINGYVSYELMDSARILVGKDMGYAVLQRIDYENYSGLTFDLVPDEEGVLRWQTSENSIYWVNEYTLEFIADLRGDIEEKVEFHVEAAIQYDFQQRHMAYSILTEYDNEY